MAIGTAPITSVNPRPARSSPRSSPTPRPGRRGARAGAGRFPRVARRSFAERAVPMHRLAAILRERADRYAKS